MFCLVPRRAPYSDWLAQVARIIERRTCARRAHIFDSAYLRSCYDMGLSPQEIADDLME